MARNQQIVYVVNRSTVPLDCMSDGVPFVLQPGYRREAIIDPATGQQEVDKITLEPVFAIVGAAPGGRVNTEPVVLGAAMRARRQHPIMGTEDPDAMNSGEFLVAIPAMGHDFSHVEQTAAPERFDRRLMMNPGQQAVLVTRGRRKRPKVGQSGLTRSSTYLPELWNPAGIEVGTMGRGR
jgi:hypothetical protein